MRSGKLRIVVAVLLAAPHWKSIEAQPSACRSSAGVPDTLARISVHSSATDARDSAIVRAYAESLEPPQFGVPRHFKVAGRQHLWEVSDLARSALTLGAKPPFIAVVDRVRRTTTSGALTASIFCVRGNTRHALGSYRLPFDIVHDSVQFRPAVLDALRGTVTIKVDSLVVHSSSVATPNQRALEADAKFLRETAEQLHLPIPVRIDILILSASDTTLRALGIDSFVDPFTEVTADNLILSAPQASGGVSRHELIHALTADVPMHPAVAQGLAVFFGGTLGMSLYEGACKERSALTQQDESSLRVLLGGTAAHGVNDHVRSLLFGFLGAIMSHEPQSSWLLNQATSPRTSLNGLVTTWNQLLHSTLEDCSKTS